MSAIMILVFMAGLSSGGIHTQKVEFATHAQCEVELKLVIFESKKRDSKLKEAFCMNTRYGR